MCNLSEFEEYALEEQRQGREVYIGKDIALEIDREEGLLCVQDGWSGYFIELKETWRYEKELREITKQENRIGVKPELTDKIKNLMSLVGGWVDAELQHELEAYHGFEEE